MEEIIKASINWEQLTTTGMIIILLLAQILELRKMVRGKDAQIQQLQDQQHTDALRTIEVLGKMESAILRLRDAIS